MEGVAETLESAEARQARLRRLCAAVGGDVEALERERLCAFMNVEEARALQAGGIDIELHSHRHRFPAESYRAAEAEIEDNRRALAPVADRTLRHFCYPSGDYEDRKSTRLNSSH